MLRRLFSCFTNKTNPDNNVVFPQIPVINQDQELDQKTNTTDETEFPGLDPSNINLFDTVSMEDSFIKNKSIDWKDTIPFVPPINQGYVIKVYDGDTITIASKLPYPESPLYRFSVRLNGIDCPEMKGKDNNEKQCAQIAKNEVIELVLNKEIHLKNIQTEKYGRILADVYINNLHVNQHLIEKRLAVKYDGGTKISPKNWLDYYYKGEL
jgi:endonuclease YncB( thermonuclease family)